jgi:hypothetical protein
MPKANEESWKQGNEEKRLTAEANFKSGEME